MRVLFFNYEYPPLGGGAGNATLYILREFSKMPSLEVDLVTSSVDAQYHLEAVGANVRIHKLPIGKNQQNLHFQSQKDLLVYAWKAYWFSRELIKKNKFDLTHSFFTVPCGFLSLLFKAQYGLPYIVSLRGSDVPGYSDRFAFIYNFLKPLTRLIWKRSFAVVSNSEGLQELAQKTKADQSIGIIYNGIDINTFRPNESLKSANKFIVTPGASRVTTRKGLNYLVEAVAKLAPKYPQIMLKVMGEGDAQADLEELARKVGIGNNVEFLGRIPREKTAPYYQEADVFVLPSLNEGMSNAMLEALATGLPLIATDCGGSKELIGEDENGFFIKMRDAQDIADKLEKLITNKKLCQRLGQNSRVRAEAMSWEKVAKKYYDLYQTTE
jgi:glycosyltransferase involved in cell wall biosynthesis